MLRDAILRTDELVLALPNNRPRLRDVDLFLDVRRQSHFRNAILHIQLHRRRNYGQIFIRRLPRPHARKFVRCLLRPVRRRERHRLIRVERHRRLAPRTVGSLPSAHETSRFLTAANRDQRAGEQEPENLCSASHTQMIGNCRKLLTVRIPGFGEYDRAAVDVRKTRGRCNMVKMQQHLAGTYGTLPLVAPYA